MTVEQTVSPHLAVLAGNLQTLVDNSYTGAFPVYATLPNGEIVALVGIVGTKKVTQAAQVLAAVGTFTPEPLVQPGS